MGLIPRVCARMVRFDRPGTLENSNINALSFSVSTASNPFCTPAVVNQCTAHSDFCSEISTDNIVDFDTIHNVRPTQSGEILLARVDTSKSIHDPTRLIQEPVPINFGGPLRYVSPEEEQRIASVRDAVMREQRKTELCNQARNGDGEALRDLEALLGQATPRTASQRRLFDSLYERVLETRVTELERRIVAATNKEELDELITEVRTFFNEQEDQAQSNEQKTRLRRFATQLLVGSSDKPGIARRALELALEAEDNTDDLDNDVLDTNGRRRSGVRGNTSRAMALFRGAENAIREAMRVDPRNSTLRAQLLRVQRSRLEYAAQNGTSYYTRREGQEYTRLYNNAAQCLRTVRDPDYLRECAETVRLAGPYAIQEQVWTPYGQFVGTRAGTGLDAIASRADQSALAGLYNNNGGYTSLVPAGAAGANGIGGVAGANNDQAIRATAAMIAAQQGRQPGALGVNQQLINAGATGVGGLPPAVPNMPGAAGTAGLFRL